MAASNQETLFPDEPAIAPQPGQPSANVWNKDNAKGALDELFSLTFQYKTSKAYEDLLKFVGRFGFYSPFNAMLVHMQMPGAQYVAPPYRWLHDYERKIKPGARPLVILKPMGPVMFVFDVSDTEGKPLPPEIEKPFEVRQGSAGDSLRKTIENSKRDGVAIHTAKMGSQQGGSIRVAESSAKTIAFKETFIPVRYQIELDQAASEQSRYASLAHELAHLYCGHLGTPNDRWWPDRRGLSHAVCELEAE